ncbi:hypothetical protein [Halomarina ordinaria]|uniref:Asparagine synthetase domain-containing protein n=1 Tax=Halomarina ordinaria TaxID=3033939 RepID=A0ABD5U763_9EURY|nr:hypothetical protein [Halomarina sp. PSRA2]
MNDLIDSVLYFGYYPVCARSSLPDVISRSASAQVPTLDRDELVTNVQHAFGEAIDAELALTDCETTHVVPLSAGLDSRAILGGLLDHPAVDLSDIHTISFGSPGTWDLEIGRQVAEVAGVSNTAIDLSVGSFDWSLGSIREYAASRKTPGRVLDGYVNSQIPTLVEDDAVIWSGFMGDPSVGGHQPDQPSKDWGAACEYFADHERYCGGLVSSQFDPVSVLPDEPYITRKKLSYEEQLDFALRQQCLIAPIVLHSNHYRTPFLRPCWLDVALNLPRQHRKNRNLFKEAFLNAFPELFSLPTDAHFGLPLTANRARGWIRSKRLGLAREIAAQMGIPYLHPATNYIDFAAAFRTDCELRDSMYLLVSKFCNRTIDTEIDPLRIWREHQDGRDHSNEIRAISSLELYLDARA